MIRAIVFLGLINPAFASQTLDALVNAAGGFAVAIHQQHAVIQNNQAPATFASKTIEYAEAKTTYFRALRAAVPELTRIAMRRQARPAELDHLAEAFSLAGEKQELMADQKTLSLLKRFSGNPAIEKARTVFERAQKAEEDFHKDFDGLDFSRRYSAS